MKILTMRRAMVSLCALLTALLLPSLSNGQSAPTWNQHIAPIVFANCSGCHHPGAIGPFSLMTYAEVSAAAASVYDAVNTGRMPPWPPDPSYRQLAHERVLSDNEIQLISDWVLAGTPEGTGTPPPAPVFSSGSQIGTPELTVQMQTYTVQSSLDEYRCFVVPSTLTQDKYINAFEVIPGNKSIVHHVLVFYDTSGTCLAADNADPLPGYTCGGGTGCGNRPLVGSWVPGSQPQVYPPALGVPAKAGGHFVMQIHYAPGSQGQKDSTKINLKFSSTAFTRPVFISAPLEHTYTLTNGPLVIPPNTVKAFHSQYTVPGMDVSVLAVGPHMHLRGKSIRSFGVHPSAPLDTIKFIRIPEWDFHWQGAYMFPKLIKVPGGTVMHANAVYDNTSANPHNPNPNTVVTLGEGTEDEMLLVYFAYTYYLPGDENIILDSATVFPTSATQPASDTYFEVHPNPARDNAVVYINTSFSTTASLKLYDLQGRLVKEFWTNRTIANRWNTESIEVSSVAPGIYMLSLESNGSRTTRKLVVF